jgi:steroid delta-isomerase-like uncharacterized protein
MENADIARKVFECWNERDFDGGAALMADDGEIVLVGSDTHFRGADGSREYSRMWADGFPDGRVQIEEVIASGDRVVVEYTGRGTHAGDLRSPGGTIPATGRSVTHHACDVYEMQNGRIRSARVYFDTASLMTQLGVMAGASAEAIR